MALAFGPTVRTLLRHPSAGLLIAAEVAFSLTLLVHLATLQRNAGKAAHRDTGLQPDTLFLVDSDGADAEARLLAIAGVTKVARIDQPLHAVAQLPAAVRSADGRAALAWMTAGAATLPETLGLERVDRRADPPSPDDSGDSGDSEDAALITVSLAHALFGDAAAVGQRLELPPRARPLRITGVVRDVLFTTGWASAAANGLVIATPPAATRRASFVVRTDAATAPRFAAAAGGALAGARFRAVESLRTRLERNHANAAGTLVATSVLILILILGGTLGGASMVALLVTARTREIGLRRALGARRGQVVGQIVFEAFLMAAVGMLAGLALTAAVALLLGMRASDFDPRIVIAGAAVAFALPLVSSWIPARRAARIPMAIAGKAL
jgi:hypothetical protein